MTVTSTADQDSPEYSSMTHSTAGDFDIPPALRHTTFSEAIGTGNFRQRSYTGDVGEKGESVSRDGNVEQQYATGTETLGFESKNEKYLKCGDPAEGTRWSPSSIVAGSEARTSIVRDDFEEIKLSIFPPLLTSLKANGRPRFNLEKSREGGRLLIVTVPNDRPEVLRIPKKDGRVRLQFIDDCDHDEEK